MNAYLNSGGHFYRRSDGLPSTPRVSGLERQLAPLLQNARGVTFTPGAEGPLSPAFVRALARSVVDSIGARRPTTRATRRAALGELPLGVSPRPRRLHPDHEPKTIRYTPIEKLLFIPAGALVEVDPAVVRRYCDDDVVADGCPRCGGPFEDIFFFTRHLHDPRATDPASRYVKGRCQHCNRTSDLRAPDNFD
jgi:hypothetical protein